MKSDMTLLDHGYLLMHYPDTLTEADVKFLKKYMALWLRKVARIHASQVKPATQEDA